MGLREARQFTRAQASLLWQAICRGVLGSFVQVFDIGMMAFMEASYIP